MNFLRVLFFLAFSMSALAGDWRETLTPPAPGAFPPLRPLKATYKFGWGALTAADATFQTAKTKDGKLRLAVHTQTTGMVRALFWQMDIEHTALADAEMLRPIQLKQTEMYSSDGQSVKAAFQRDRVERIIEDLPAGKNRPTKKTFQCDHVFDLHTALLFVRSQPLRTGDVIRLVVFPAKSLYLAEVEVLGRDELSVAAGRYPALKCDVRLRSMSRDLVLKPHQKFKRAVVWLSDDKDRLLLKIDSEVFVGSVWAELESVKFAEK